MFAFGSKMFDINGNEKTLSQEISTLTGGDDQKLFGRIYQDACDVGFILISAATGKESIWFCSNAVKDSEGELLFWEFKPTSETLRKLPTLKGWKIKVFND